jgi:hypothetical protein
MQKNPVTEEWLAKVGRVLRARKSREACPNASNVITYALGELEGDAVEKIQVHIYECVECLNLVVDVRWATDACRSEKQNNK